MLDGVGVFCGCWLKLSDDTTGSRCGVAKEVERSSSGAGLGHKCNVRLDTPL